MLNVVLTTYWYCCPWGVLLHGLHIIPSCYYEQNVILTTYWYCCPWRVLLHASQSILFCSRWLICPWGVLLHAFHFIPSWNYDPIFSETNRWLEHPALLAGCVCVYLLKRSKTCTSCGCWTSYWLLIDYLLTTYWYICPWGVLLHVSQFIPFYSSRGARPPVMTLPNKASHWRGSEVWSTSCTCNMNMDMVIKLCWVGVSLGFLFQAVVSQWKGTSSVMTLALDASVFVKVCVFFPKKEGDGTQKWLKKIVLQICTWNLCNFRELCIPKSTPGARKFLPLGAFNPKKMLLKIHLPQVMGRWRLQKERNKKGFQPPRQRYVMKMESANRPVISCHSRAGASWELPKMQIQRNHV